MSSSETYWSPNVVRNYSWCKLVYGFVEIGQSAVFLLCCRGCQTSSVSIDVTLSTDISHIQIWHLFAGPSQAGLCLVLNMGPKQTTHTLNVVGLMM